jgi:hypothetical protein
MPQVTPPPSTVEIIHAEVRTGSKPKRVWEKCPPQNNPKGLCPVDKF